MPTIFFKFGLRFYFVSYDCIEPVHVHVTDDANKVCNLWLKNKLSKLERVVKENYLLIITTFNDSVKNIKNHKPAMLWIDKLSFAELPKLLLRMKLLSFWTMKELFTFP